MNNTLKALLATAVVFAGSTSCVLDDPDIPELSGPSEMGTSVEMRANPDQLVADGFSSSVIEAVVRNPNGERTSGVTILFDISRGGVFLDLGNLAPLNGPRPTAGGVESGPVSSVSDAVSKPVRAWKSGSSAARPPATDARSARACSSVTPPASRPTTWT